MPESQYPPAPDAPPIGDPDCPIDSGGGDNLDDVQAGDFARYDYGLRYLFIDFNAYFASVEQHDDAYIFGKPVIVIPLDSAHTSAIAVSYEAKAMGIRRGTSLVEARSICPDIAVRVARHDRYVEMHHLLLAEIENHVPILRVCSIDECVCRLNPEEMEPAPAKALAQRIKQGLYSNVGPAMRCSIGLAPSTLLAKLAGELHKPDGLTAIQSGELPMALADIPLGDIPGVGNGVSRRLERAGIRRFEQLWNLAPKQARAIWGSVAGERFIYALKGYDVPEGPPPKKAMIGHSRRLSGPHRQREGARIVGRALLLKAASRLRHYGLYASSLSVSVKLYPEGRIGREARFRASRNSWRFMQEFQSLWDDISHMLNAMGKSQCAFSQVSVHLHGLSDQPPEADLFIDEDVDITDHLQARLWGRIDGLNRRYGMKTIMPASQMGLDLNYLGVKIAFSRVPEAAEFADRPDDVRARLAGAKHHRGLRENAGRSLY
ncbi:Y-family DNA polymerase [Parasphingorhabdus sp. DH2-15]|uniref:Y-family DNA polymerase n=1 Tax=Parasphingorhabdus sp. DH2-15 TaxID=3444112 RepID=UPI003F687CA5